MKKILAQYTIRSKQNYIFRSNRILEIVGASENISKSWDVLFEQADKVFAQEGTLEKKTLRIKDKSEFKIAEIDRAFDSKSLHMVELFRGGGNETVLFDSMDSYVKVNKAFSYYLLKEYPGMIPMAVCCEYTGDYRKDYNSLMQAADREKNRMISGQREFILPFSMMDRNTFQPYSRAIQYEGEVVRFTDEAYSKRRQGLKISNEDPKVKILDNMVTKKGEESLLAVVHADGNNMGVKIAKMLEGNTDYDFCISKMRKFTEDTDKVFSKAGLEAIKKRRDELWDEYGTKSQNNHMFLYRKIVADGDDVTFVCNARFAMEYVKAYLKSVQEYHEKENSEWLYSSCAGICIFHSHYPFARAYAMAEQACDNAKKRVHSASDKEGAPMEEGWADFHYIHNGIGGNLESVRERQGTDRCMARPWLIAGEKQSESQNYDELGKLSQLLTAFYVSRSDIKTIGSEYENSPSCGRQELIRIYGHHKGLKEALGERYQDENNLLKMIYDLSEVYDLWFTKAKEG